MNRMEFDSSGKLIGMDGKLGDFSDRKKEEERERRGVRRDLKTSESLEFLKEKKFEGIFDKKHWSLYSDDKKLDPLIFSNGKSQEDIVEEIVGLINEGNKVIFLHGVCGTGKSAIALNIARSLGKASIVVPIKSLQRQYEEEYMENKYVIKPNGKKMKIAMMTGRDNHDSIIEPGKSCAYPYLPDTIKITEKNAGKLREFYSENPFINNNRVPGLRELKRISIAPSNPYWSPILPAEVDLGQLKDAKKRKYTGMFGKKFVFYHRKSGCSYYDQYLSYFDADVIIFNSAKYLAEVAMNRKPRTDVEIIDEADEFLDSLSNQIELNLTRLAGALRLLVPDSDSAITSIKKILDLLDLEEKNKRAIGVDEDKVYHINEGKIKNILEIFLGDSELQAEVAIDDLNYANVALEASRNFKDSWKDTYSAYKKDEEGLKAVLVTTDLSKKFRHIVDGNKAVVLMSGTLHSPRVLKNIFGIEDFASVDAETLNQGAIEICRTGKEFDCRYSNFKSEKFSREDYLRVLSGIVDKAKKPVLAHVNAFSDLPSSDEVMGLGINNLISRERLKELQFEDKTGKRVSLFREGANEVLFTTKCSRGIDFPGERCNSVVFTKYPNPNVKDTFWRILQKTHPDYYWDFYKDKARREFLQRIYRAVRSKNDHVYVMSPDSRVLDAVRNLQVNGN